MILKMGLHVYFCIRQSSFDSSSKLLGLNYVIFIDYREQRIVKFWAAKVSILYLFLSYRYQWYQHKKATWTILCTRLSLAEPGVHNYALAIILIHCVNIIYDVYTAAFMQSSIRVHSERRTIKNKSTKTCKEMHQHLITQNIRKKWNCSNTRTPKPLSFFHWATFSCLKKQTNKIIDGEGPTPINLSRAS